MNMPTPRAGQLTTGSLITSAWKATLLTTFLLGGCATVGPASISNGRMVYNEVINYTDDQQILNAIVRERYGQTFSMLTVSSVTANVKFRASADSEFQAWESSSDTDLLVPLSLGIGYEENPTISYTPVQGEVVLRSLISPIAVDEGFLVLGIAKERQLLERYFYRRLNDLQVPVDGSLSPELKRLETVARTLREAGIYRFGRAAGSDDRRPQYVLILSDYSEEQRVTVREYLDLLGVENQIVDGRNIVLPYYGPLTEKEAPDGIYVETRSVYEWLRIAGSMIEVPEPHLAAGIVEPAGWSGPEEDRLITIRTSRQQPDDAVVSIPFRGWWYYIDATDSRSKESFRVIKFLVRLRLNQESSQQRVPVLTVPVG